MSLSTIQNDFRRVWRSVAPYAASPIAASAAIVPVFYGFEVKSARQLSNPVPAITVNTLKISLRVAPIIGGQVFIQERIEAIFKEKFSEGLGCMAASSVVVGTISAPALAAFNGQTMGKSMIHAVKALTLKQTGAIVLRETGFLLALRLVQPISKEYGKTKPLEYGLAFATGAFGSISCHSADTALTCWQKGIKITSFSQSMQGALAKAVTVGLFAMGYKCIKEFIS